MPAAALDPPYLGVLWVLCETTYIRNEDRSFTWRPYLREEQKEIEKAIKEKGAKWKAEKTNVSKLSVEERRKRLGLIPTEEELKKNQ